MIVGYVRVSTEGQAAEGVSLDAQRSAIQRWAGERTIGHTYEDVISTRAKVRPGLDQAIEAARTTQGTLVVARLDRLSRSVGEFAALLDRSMKEGWQLVTLDPQVDSSTPYGRAMAQMAAVFAQLERELISQRTKEGLAATRARGTRLGSPPSFPPEVQLQILALDGHMSRAAIARRFGLKPDTVQAWLRRREAREAA